MLGGGKVVVTVRHPNNSYVELWDVGGRGVMGVYDRAFFGLEVLEIRDVYLADGYLYLLDYATGVYQL